MIKHLFIHVSLTQQASVQPLPAHVRACRPGTTAVYHHAGMRGEGLQRGRPSHWSRLLAARTHASVQASPPSSSISAFSSGSHASTTGSSGGLHCMVHRSVRAPLDTHVDQRLCTPLGMASPLPHDVFWLMLEVNHPRSPHPAA